MPWREPFTRYATEYILLHANNSQKVNADQSSFLETFQKHYTKWAYSRWRLKLWLQVDAPPLLYSLSICGADELIRIHPERDRHFELQGGLYGLPLLGAVYSGHNAAARALLGLPRLTEESSTGIQSKARSTNHLKKENFRKGRHILSILCEYGDVDILRCVLTSKNGDGITIMPKELYAHASSEAIVDTLMSFQGSHSVLMNSYQQILETPDRLGNNSTVSTDLPFLTYYLSERPSAIADSGFWGIDSHLLTYAASRGFIRIVRLCIMMDGGSYYHTNRLAVLKAAISGPGKQEGRLLVLEQLLEAAALALDEQELLGEHLFEAICRPFNEDIVRFILARFNINLEVTNEEGLTLLLWAISQGRKAYVKMFLEAGSDPMARVRYDGATALMLTVKLSDYGSFRLLIEHQKCRFDARDDYGRTALSWCAMVADECAVKMIYHLWGRAGVLPNSVDTSGRTALMRAVDSANEAVVSTLSAFPGIEADSGPSHRSTPLRLSIMRYIETRHQGFLEIALRLLKVGADLDCAKKVPTPAELIARHDTDIPDNLRKKWQAQKDEMDLLTQISEQMEIWRSPGLP